MSANTAQIKIGVIDSGVGGLTVVRELERLLPGLSAVYYGDSANCPYGNRGEDEIFALAGRMLHFMEQKGATLVVLACNCMSAIAPRLEESFGLPVLSIIEPAAAYAAMLDTEDIGVVATAFTISSGCYERAITALRPDVRVHGEASRELAALVDSGSFETDAVARDVQEHMDNLTEHLITHCILGCTHYPIVLNAFERAAPDVRFIDPARCLAREIERRLTSGGQRPNGGCFELDAYTSGNTAVYEQMFERLGISGASITHRMV